MEKEKAAAVLGTATARNMIDNDIVQHEGQEVHSRFLTAKEIAADMQISEGSAYRLIRRLNKQLEDAGRITVRGRVNRRFYMQMTEGLEL